MVRAARRRGRPPKFGRPSRVVALTLPNESVRKLKSIHSDLAWAVVTLLQQQPADGGMRTAGDVDLVPIADRHSLIVVNQATLRQLPGVQLIPITRNRALLALEAGRGMADLELAVIDRLGAAKLSGAERRTLEALRALLARWRHDRTLRIHTRAIIVVEKARTARRQRGRGR